MEKSENLLEAVKLGNLEDVMHLCESNPRLLNDSQDGQPVGSELLRQAIIANHLAVAEYLLKHGVRPSSYWGHGYSSHLHSAAGTGNPHMVRLLLSHGADISALEGDGYTVLHRAIFNCTDDEVNPAKIPDFIQTIQVLIASGVDVNALDELGDAPLHDVAGEHDHLIPIKIVHTRDPRRVYSEVSNSRTQQLAPVRDAALKIALLLLENGADPALKNSEGDTPFCIAAANNSTEVARMLAQYGADVHCPNGTGITPLRLAAHIGNESIQQIIAAHGQSGRADHRTLYGSPAQAQHPYGHPAPSQDQYSVPLSEKPHEPQAIPSYGGSSPSLESQPYRSAPTFHAKSSDADTALILSIIGLLCCAFLAPVSIVYAMKARKQIDQNPDLIAGRKATVALVIGIIGSTILGFNVIFLIALLARGAGASH
ncbi:MAG: ankyrin-like [Chthonomonadaceae bacterium]|nr:ankyrin-like [Chthonomonadaceae bacterium]